MFRATMCQSSGETTVFMRHLILCIPPCIPDSHPHTIASTKCRVNTVVSPDDGHQVGFIYKCRKSVTTIIIINIIKNLNPTNLFISIFNQLDAQNLFHSKFYFMPLHVSSTCAHHQVKIALHSLWYHQTYRWPYRARDGHL